MKIKIALIALFVMFATASFGQELKLQSFELKPVDMTAKVDPVLDLNNEACALIRVAIASQEVTFQGNIVGEPTFVGGEWLVYVPANTQRLKVARKGYLPLTVEFDIKIEQFRTYEMRIETPVIVASSVDKTRAIVMPTISVGYEPMSYGVMIGFVKKNGMFFRYKSNFDNMTTSFTVDDQGVDEEGNNRWFTGEERRKRWAATVGYIRRLGDRFYLLGGIGYGVRTVGWEGINGDYASVSTYSLKGFEAEVGAAVRFGSFALSAGIQSNQFKFVEGNISVGFMF